MDLEPDHPYHRATLVALRHAADHLSMPVDVRVVRTDAIRSGGELLAGSAAAVVIGPGSPYADPDAAMAAVRTAREAGVPLVGT